MSVLSRSQKWLNQKNVWQFPFYGSISDNLATEKNELPQLIIDKTEFFCNDIKCTVLEKTV